MPSPCFVKVGMEWPTPKDLVVSLSFFWDVKRKRLSRHHP